MASFPAAALVAWALISGSLGAPEIFKNPGMEDPDIDGAYGHAWGYQATRESLDVHSGSYAVKLSNRTQYWQGLGQDVSLKPGGRYSVHAYIKQLTNTTKLWQRYSFTGSYQWAANSTQKSYLDLARHSFGTTQEGWFKLGGDFSTPSRPWSHLNVYIQGPDPGIDFLVDDFSLQEIPEDPAWRTNANTGIDQLRKTNFTLTVNVAGSFDPHHVDVEVNLKSHRFGWGTVISPDMIVNPEYKTYQNLFYEFFNWATNGNYKWGYNQGNLTNPNYDAAIRATEELRKHGIPVRGHNMFWGVPQYEPDWMKHTTGPELRKIIRQRAEYMTNITMHKLEHWDVNNELLHGQVYEEITGDPTYSQEIYRTVHQLDPYPKLFLNDYNVVSVGAVTDDYVNQANQFKAANCGLYGLGVQSHFPGNTKPDPTLMKYRLDKLASTGLPLWVTELTLTTANVQQRADWFEDALTVYFGHPAVEGVIFWGFWDHDGTDPNGALVNGNNYFINDAGKRYLELVKNRWSTNVKSTLSASNTDLDIRGFQGDYDVIVRYRGKPIKMQQFSLEKGEDGKSIVVNVDGNGDEIVLPTPHPTSIAVNHVHHVSSTNVATLGTASVTSGPASLTCTTRYSGLSAVGDDQAAEVTCQTDEVMTGCSGITKDGQFYRDGDLFSVSHNVATCRAINSWQSSAPVQAVARCCKKASLQCQYIKAGPSGHGAEDRAEIACPAGYTATGCTAYTYFRDFDGSFTNGSACFAQNDGTQGVFAYAACCNVGTGSTCTVRQSHGGGITQGATSSVSCHQGETLVGCSVFSEDGKTAGAVPHDDGSCVATNGQDKFPGESGAVAMAVCCT